MKNTHIYISLAAIIFAGCQPERPTLDDLLSTDQVSFEVKKVTDNIVQVKNTTPDVLVKWDFDNGATSTKMLDTAKYPKKGEYTIKMTAFASGGATEKTYKLTISEDNPTLLNIPIYNFLTGGSDSINGKTWRPANETKGHIILWGVGGTVHWWEAGKDAKANTGYYDDRFTFNLNGLTYTYKNNGNTLAANGANAAELKKQGATGGNEQGENISFTPPTNMTFSLNEKDSILTFTESGFLGFYTNVSEYKILEVNDTVLRVRSKLETITSADAGGVAWDLMFYRDGFTPYIPPPVQKKYKIENIQNNFDGNGNIEWKKENVELEIIENPFPSTTPLGKIGKYTRLEGEENQWGNLQVNLDYKMDLTQRNIFKVKVWIPSFNDYTKDYGKAGDWIPDGILDKTVELKLQDASLGGDAWKTQLTVRHTITEAQLNTWVELTFDFSASGTADATAREDFDRIILQIGGEGNRAPGVFYFDDFKLEE